MTLLLPLSNTNPAPRPCHSVGSDFEIGKPSLRHSKAATHIQLRSLYPVRVVLIDLLYLRPAQQLDFLFNTDSYLESDTSGHSDYTFARLNNADRISGSRHQI